MSQRLCLFKGTLGHIFFIHRQSRLAQVHFCLAFFQCTSLDKQARRAPRHAIIQSLMVTIFSVVHYCYPPIDFVGAGGQISISLSAGGGMVPHTHIEETTALMTSIGQCRSANQWTDDVSKGDHPHGREDRREQTGSELLHYGGTANKRKKIPP